MRGTKKPVFNRLTQLATQLNLLSDLYIMQLLALRQGANAHLVVACRVDAESLFSGQ